MLNKNKIKEPFIVLMTFHKETLAEIAKNSLKEEVVLSKAILRERVKYNVHDFMFLNFINDDNKIFTVLFQVNIKDTPKEIKKLTSFVEEVFECKNIQIENKKDFNFDKFNLKNGLVKNDILLASKDNKQTLKPNLNNTPTQVINYNNLSQKQIDSYNFHDVIGHNANEVEPMSFKKVDSKESFTKKIDKEENLFDNIKEYDFE